MISAIYTFTSHLFFGVFYLVLLLFLVVLLVARRQDKRLRRQGRWVRAKALACVDHSHRDKEGAAVSEVFETTFEFEWDGAPRTLVYKGYGSYPVGHYVPAYYRQESGLFKPEHTMKADQGAGFYVMLGVILAFTVIITLQLEGIFPPWIEEQRLRFTALFACGAFVVAGLIIWLQSLRVLLSPRTRRIEGVVVDTVKRLDTSTEPSGRCHYYPIYTYWDEGRQQNQMGTAGYTYPPKVGEKLDLTKDLKTGSVRLTGDLGAGRRLGMFLTLFSLGLFVLVFFIKF